jgi:hypothetical protein
MGCLTTLAKRPGLWLLVAIAPVACSAARSGSGKAHEAPVTPQQTATTMATASVPKPAVPRGPRDRCQPVPATRSLPPDFPAGWYAAEPIDPEVPPGEDAEKMSRILRFAVRFERERTLRVREDQETVVDALSSADFTRAHDRWKAQDWTEVHCWPAPGAPPNALPIWHPVRLDVQVVPTDNHGFIYSQLAAPPLPSCVSSTLGLCEHWRLEAIPSLERAQRLDALVARALDPENCQTVAACCASESGSSEPDYSACRGVPGESDPLSCYAALQKLRDLLGATQGPCGPPEG